MSGRYCNGDGATESCTGVQRRGTYAVGSDNTIAFDAGCAIQVAEGNLDPVNSTITVPSYSLVLRAVIAVVTIWILACPGWVFAQENFPARIALVIGNGDYPGLDRLLNPGNDYDDVSEALRGLGFVIYGGKDLGQREMGLRLDEYIDALRRTPGALALFYFAGHGSQRSGASGTDNLLWPAQEKPDSSESLALRLNTVIARMHDAGAAAKVVILDACRTNSADGARGPRGLAVYDGAVAGLLIAYASAAGQVADDDRNKRNGFYTSHLLEQLRVAGLSMHAILTRTSESVQKTRRSGQLPEIRMLGSDRRLSEMPMRVARAKTASSGSRTNESPSSVPVPNKSGNSDEALAIAPLFEAEIRATARPGSIASMTPGSSFRDCDICPEMVVIPAGSFLMGVRSDEVGSASDERPRHKVSIARPFAAGKYEVTRAQFARFVQESGYAAGPGCLIWTGNGWRFDSSRDWRNPGFPQTDNHPVTCVNWYDAKAYAEWIKSKAGKEYRLLTEAEWEYAARAGTITLFSTGDTINSTQANFDSTVYAASGSVISADVRPTVRVGSYAPNAFGLYDVHGNVSEWTVDCYHPSHIGAPADGGVWINDRCSKERVMRGGSWHQSPQLLRSAHRSYYEPTFRSAFFGLRLARTD